MTLVATVTCAFWRLNNLMASGLEGGHPDFVILLILEIQKRIIKQNLQGIDIFAPENWWLEDDSFPFKNGFFSGAPLLVFLGE